MSTHSGSYAVRLQGMSFPDQTVVLSRIAQARAESGYFSVSDVDLMFVELDLPRPAKTSNILAGLERKGYVVRKGGRGAVWRLTPLGRQHSYSVFSDVELASAIAEAEASDSPRLGEAAHPVIPPSFAPPELLKPLASFLEDHPFENNVFGMTRFPDEQEKAKDTDPMKKALAVARDVCKSHGLELHLASDRAISDDLWTNVAGHMWASKYGIAFFENRRGKGLNYNLTIEVGSMLITGRRCALLRDDSISSMPTDLVGRIYKSVNLDDLETVGKAVEGWITADLASS